MEIKGNLKFDFSFCLKHKSHIEVLDSFKIDGVGRVIFVGSCKLHIYNLETKEIEMEERSKGLTYWIDVIRNKGRLMDPPIFMTGDSSSNLTIWNCLTLEKLWEVNLQVGALWRCYSTDNHDWDVPENIRLFGGAWSGGALIQCLVRKTLDDKKHVYVEDEERRRNFASENGGRGGICLIHQLNLRNDIIAVTYHSPNLLKLISLKTEKTVSDIELPMRSGRAPRGVHSYVELDRETGEKKDIIAVLTGCGHVFIVDWQKKKGSEVIFDKEIATSFWTGLHLNDRIPFLVLGDLKNDNKSEKGLRFLYSVEKKEGSDDFVVKRNLLDSEVARHGNFSTVMRWVDYENYEDPRIVCLIGSKFGILSLRNGKEMRKRGCRFYKWKEDEEMKEDLKQRVEFLLFLEDETSNSFQINTSGLKIMVYRSLLC